MVRPARFSLGMGRAKLTPDFEVQQVRRLAQVALFATLAAGCGAQRRSSAPRLQPGTMGAPLFDAGSLYRRMGFLVADPPLPFVASIRYLADSAPDSTLAVFALSLANPSLSFQRDGSQFVAQYHVEVSFRGDAAAPRHLTSDETVRVRTFQETQRGDESVIYQQFVDLAPGPYVVSVTLRDRNSPSSARQERSDTVPRFAGRGFSSPIPIYEGRGRTRLAELPKLLVNTRATLPYGGDSLRFYIEAYGLPRGARLAVRAVNRDSIAVATDTVPLAGDASLATAQFAFRPGELPVGEGLLEVATVAAAGTTSSNP